jgi:hypothetical protein
MPKNRRWDTSPVSSDMRMSIVNCLQAEGRISQESAVQLVVTTYTNVLDDAAVGRSFLPSHRFLHRSMRSAADASGGPTMNAPVAPFSHLSALWIQVTGTWCNLRCVHCINASGPADPWLKSLDTESVQRSIKEAKGLGGQGGLFQRRRALPPPRHSGAVGLFFAGGADHRLDQRHPVHGESGRYPGDPCQRLPILAGDAYHGRPGLSGEASSHRDKACQHQDTNQY